jgi:hypothetical protein
MAGSLSSHPAGRRWFNASPCMLRHLVRPAMCVCVCVCVVVLICCSARVSASADGSADAAAATAGRQPSPAVFWGEGRQPAGRRGTGRTVHCPKPKGRPTGCCLALMQHLPLPVYSTRVRSPCLHVSMPPCPCAAAQDRRQCQCHY